MKRIAPAFPLKALSSALFTTSLLVATLDAQASVSQSPLSLTTSVPPNVIFTFDDSTSMNAAFVPDSIGEEYSTRKSLSFDFNSMYYNPKAIYKKPAKVDSNGNETELATSFNKAFYDGFSPTKNSGKDWANLSNNYQPNWNYSKSNTGRGSYTSDSNAGLDNTLAKNPAIDFAATIKITTNNTAREITTPAGITFKITRLSSKDSFTCEVLAPAEMKSLSPACSLSDSNYTASLRQRSVPAYYYVYDSTLSTCATPNKTDDNCYKLTFVSSTSGTAIKPDKTILTDERENFAIWYSFYRTRALATLSSASLAFMNFSSSSRLTWQSLIHCTSLDTSPTNCGTNTFRTYDNTQRANFLDWLQNKTKFDDAKGTPLRSAMTRAGIFLSTDKAWQKTPDKPAENNSANTYACRPSYQIVMTDGMWNGDGGFANPTNHDNSAEIVLPDGKKYTNTLTPYKDATNATLADIAMHYWATDLNSGLDNKLKPYTPFTGKTDDETYWDPRNNPATWQHMTNYMMGLGLTNSLQQSGLEWKDSTFSGAGYEALKNGTQNWPAASSKSDNNVYDLWHAAINSRGEFFSVDSPQSMVQAFNDIIDRIAARKSVAAKPATNSGQVADESSDGYSVTTSFYQTSYSSEENWAGNLIRKDKKVEYKNGELTESVVERWEAKDKMPAAGSRNIKIASSGSSGLQDFTWANAGSVSTPNSLAFYLSRNPEELDASTTDTRGSARLDYLRGDRSLEGTTFRTRTSVLGSLYASSPAIVRGARYLPSFGNRLENNTKYTTFAESVKNRKAMVYVGGNDGMLHGFNAATGAEEFAFIPTAVYPKLSKYTGKKYTHEFYVDGSPVIADVYDGNNWRTILVGTLRAGGKSVFALDITTPGSEKLLWEFNDSKITGTDAVKMGYSFSKPTVARLATGNWAVVFGNGYEAASHTNGKAALFVLNAVTGAMLTANDKGLEVAGTAGVANGLSTPKLSDYNADGIAEFAYAGDLQGNLWRFDLHSTSGAYKVAYAEKPMFTTLSSTGSKPQPITAPPSLVPHPTGQGHLLVFGTGKYFETGDTQGDRSIAQTVYGIWDKNTRLTEADLDASGKSLSITRSQLVEQRILLESTAKSLVGSTTSEVRTISDDAVVWSSGKLGWALDLKVGSTLDGEMVIEDMVTLGRTLFFQSLVPNDDPCADGSSNWTYAINPSTGGKTQHHAFDLRFTTPGKENDIISGRKQDGEGGITATQNPDGSFDLCTGLTCVPVFPDPSSTGRQTWRIVEEQ